MRFADLERKDQVFALAASLVGVVLLGGLVVTGVWHFTVFRPSPEDIEFIDGEPFLAGRPLLATEIHGVFADLSASLALIVTGWISYRVLARVSGSGVLCLIVLAATVFTSGSIAANVIIANPAGGYEIDRVRNPIGFGLHIASVAVVIALVSFALLQTRLRRRRAGEPDPTWLDQLDY